MQKNKNILTPHRIFEFCGFLILSAAFIISLKLPAEPLTWIPFAQITVPVVNGLCALACIPLIIKPGIKWIEISLFFVQSFFTTWTGYETLGMFLYSAMIVLLFCYGFFKKYLHRKAIILVIIWGIWLSGVIPFGIARCVLVYTTFLFMLAFYYAVYSKLKELLAPLLPVQAEEATIKLPAVERTINLTDYNFTERQQKLIFDFMQYNSTYKELSDKFYISVSTVKKDMAEILRLFGVKTSEELRQLLSPYEIVLESEDEEKLPHLLNSKIKIFSKN